MKIYEAKKLAYKLMSKHGLFDWHLRISSMKRTLGLCNYRKQELSLSRLYVEASPVEAIEQTILHEIAHVLVGPRVKAHGYEWKRIARSIGVKNPSHATRTCDEHRQKLADVRQNRGPNYVVNCPTCGVIATSQRMGKKMRTCTYGCKKCRTNGLRCETA